MLSVRASQTAHELVEGVSEELWYAFSAGPSTTGGPCRRRACLIQAESGVGSRVEMTPLSLPPPTATPPKVWSLTQFYSLGFSQSRISVKKCVFDRQGAKVLGSVVLEGVLGPLRFA